MVDSIQLAKSMNQMAKSSDWNDNIFYLSCLKKLGQMGKRIYLIKKSQKVKESLFTLYALIKTYEPKKEIEQSVGEEIIEEMFGIEKTY